NSQVGRMKHEGGGPQSKPKLQVAVGRLRLPLWCLLHEALCILRPPWLQLHDHCLRDKAPELRRGQLAQMRVAELSFDANAEHSVLWCGSDYRADGSLQSQRR